MKLTTYILNKLSLVSYKDSSSRMANMVACLLLAAVLILCWTMAARVDKKLAFIIDEVELGDAESITVGEGSGISISGVPKDYLTITYNGNAYEWKVNEQYRDSLQYFKINNDNPNKHAIHNDDSQLITLQLPTPQGDVVKMQLTGAEVWKDWKSFKKQKDILVRHFAARHYLAQDSVSHADSLKLLSQMQLHAVRSFFERNGNSIVLVILDRLTCIKENGSTTHYTTSGIASTDGDKQGLCKVQFFNIMDNCYMDSGHEGGYFEIDGVNYVMKPVVKLTDWGAGHIMISHDNGHLRLRFPRPITYVGSVDSLKKKSATSSGIITLKQDYQSYPTKSDLYLPAFSSAINFDLCNLELFHEKDTIYVCDNNRHTQRVCNPKTSFLPFSLIPTFSHMTLLSGQDRLHCRVGYIDGSFVMSYLWLPLLVTLLLTAVIWLPSSPVRISGKQVRTLYNQKHISHYPSYLTLLLFIGLSYCICKSLITLKLSYTYPYFEKLTGITPVSTSLLLLLFFSLSMLINTPLLQTEGKRARISKRWTAWTVCTLLFVGLGYVFFALIDPSVSQAVIKSYFHSEVYSLWPGDWLEAFGINDTHRSVIYALLFAEGLVLILWAAFNLMWKSIVKSFHALSSRWNRWSQVICDALRPYWHKLMRPLPTKALHNISAGNKVTAYLSKSLQRAPLGLLLLASAAVVLLILGWSNTVMAVVLVLAIAVTFTDFVYKALIGAMKILFPGHLLLLIVLALIGNKFGNFGTAFITLLVILGMTHALSQVNIEKEGTSRLTCFFEMFFITAAYIGGAMVGDNGYMTNYMGFVMCLVSFYFLLARPRAYVSATREEGRREKRWVNCLLLFVVVLVLALPFVCSMMFSPEKVNYDRLARRVMLYSNFKDLERNGYRYSESDAEFMVIMSHYMQEKDSGDPLSNDIHFLHPSISTGQSPVVLNDLSAPAAFFGAYGIIVSTLVFFLLLFLLLWLVMQFSLSYVDGLRPQLTKAMQWRMLAMFMWVGTSFYIYLSYIDGLPYTGRLLPGMGVDAVGEALESAILLAFMAAVTCRKKSSY